MSWIESWEFAFLTHCRTMLMLVQEPHLWEAPFYKPYRVLKATVSSNDFDLLSLIYMHQTTLHLNIQNRCGSPTEWKDWAQPSVFSGAGGQIGSYRVWGIQYSWSHNFETYGQQIVDLVQCSWISYKSYCWKNFKSILWERNHTQNF